MWWILSAKLLSVWGLTSEDETRCGVGTVLGQRGNMESEPGCKTTNLQHKIWDSKQQDQKYKVSLLQLTVQKQLRRQCLWMIRLGRLLDLSHAMHV